MTVGPVRTRRRSAQRRVTERPGVVSSGVLLIAVASLATIFRELTGADALVTLGSYTIMTTEPVIAALVATLLADFRRTRPRWGILAFLVIAIGSVFAVSLVRGMARDAFGALFLARGQVTLPLFCLAGLALGWRGGIDVRAVRAIEWAGFLLAAVVFSRVATGFPPSDQLAFDGRPTTAYGALFMVVAALLSLSDAIRLRRRGWEFGRCALLTLACLLSRQGTVIVTLAIALPILILGERGRFKAARWLIGAYAIMVLVATPRLIALLATNSAFNAYVGQRSSNNLTRQVVWTSFLKHFPERAGVDQVLGLPLGQVERLYIYLWHGSWWRNSLHSMYFEVMSNFGYLGLAVYVVLLGYLAVILLVRRRPAARPIGPDTISRHCAFVIVLMIAIFGYSYDFRGEMAFLHMLAIAATVAAMAPRRAALTYRPGPGGAALPVVRSREASPA